MIILYLGLAQGLFLSAALLLLKRKRRISIYLIVTIILCFLSLIIFELIKNSLPIEDVITIYSIAGTIPLLIGPLFLGYVQSIVHADFKITRPFLLHFLPFAVFVFYFSASALGYYENKLNMGVFGILKGSHSLLYFSYSYLYLRKTTSASPKVKNWYNAKLLLRYIFLQIVAILLIYTIVALEAFYPDINIESDRISALLFTFFFFAFAFALILNPNETIPDKLSKTQYRFSALKDSRKKEILSGILSVLEQEKLYLNPELSLNDLAEKINMNSAHVSQVINELLNKNFNQLVNEYRVAEVKRNILDDKRTLLGIAYDCGFNSKSAFNRLFKEVEGVTPSQYKMKLLNRS